MDDVSALKSPLLPCQNKKKSPKIARDDGKLILSAINHSCLACDMADLGGKLIWFALQPDIVK